MAVKENGGLGKADSAKAQSRKDAEKQMMLKTPSLLAENET